VTPRTREMDSNYRFPVAKSNESRSGTGTVTEATKFRLEAVAYLPGTDGSNPFPSSMESAANLLPFIRLRRSVARDHSIPKPGACAHPGFLKRRPSPPA
jgi:hypothetical protein